MQAIKTTLGATAIATSALLAASVLKTPKTPENELSIKEQFELAAQRKAEINARTYNWDDGKPMAQNIANGIVTTGENIRQGAIYAYDKATDNPIPLTGAFALSTLGLGAAAIVDKKKKAQIKQANTEEFCKVVKELDAKRTELENAQKRIGEIKRLCARGPEPKREDYVNRWQLEHKEKDLRNQARRYINSCNMPKSESYMNGHRTDYVLPSWQDIDGYNRAAAELEKEANELNGRRTRAVLMFEDLPKYEQKVQALEPEVARLRKLSNDLRGKI